MAAESYISKFRVPGAQQVLSAALAVCLFGLSATLVTLPAHAQQGASDANPSQIERRIDESGPREETDRKGGPAMPGLPEAQGEDGETFILSAVSLRGVESMSPGELAPAYESLLATPVTTADAAEIANRITEIYREKGYVLSRAFVPPQTVESGVLRVQVVEGYVDAIQLNGIDDLNTDLSTYTNKVLAERPLTLATLERAILLINDMSGIRVSRSNLEEPEEGSGAFTLLLDIEYDALDGTVYFDNRGTPAVGRLQSWASAGMNSVLGWGERIQAGLFTVPNQPEELIYTEVSYLQPIGGDGLETFFSISHSTIDSGSNLGLLDTESESVRALFRVSYPVLRSRKESIWLNGFFEFRNSMESRQNSENFDDRIRVARIRANYNRGGKTYFVSAILRVSKGLDVLGSSAEGSGPLSRTDAIPKFTKVSAEATYTQDLFGPVSIQLAASGQKSANPLYSSEEFAVGGSRFGRAFDFAELTGEHGAAGSVELRYTLNDRPEWLEYLQLYSFYDHGAVWNKNASGTFGRHSLSSAGFGVRANFPWSIRTSVEVAQPITWSVFTSGNSNEPRYFFTLSKDF